MLLELDGRDDAARRRRVIASPASAAPESMVPAYLREAYTWAYLEPRNVAVLDHPLVVSAILFGNQRRLRAAVLDEIEPGARVLHTGCVYGDFSPALARHVGTAGSLDVVDVSSLQVANCSRKLAGMDHARARVADAGDPGGGPYDAACCFFLLHEVPDAHRRRVVDGVLGSVREGGKAIFVDYHRPHWAHPLRPLVGAVFDTLEPFARDLWRHDIEEFASDAGSFRWCKRTYFGGMYQKTVAARPSRGAG